jgi:multicomponent Na+:H+ antiporter subunit D
MAVANLAVAIPLIAAATLAALKPLHPGRAGDAAAIATAVATAVLCAITLARSSHDLLVYWLGGWRPQHGVAVGISLAIDPIGAAAALFAALLAVAALVFATRYIDVSEDLFHVIVLVFLAAMVGFAFAGDLFTLFVFFELMSITAFVLVGYQVEQRASLEGALNFAITNSVGSFLFLLGVGLVYGRTGALNLAQIGESLSHGHTDALVTVAFALVATGLLVKAAIVPFHFWLADAYAVARTPVCILLAGVMSELGLYGVARVYWTAFSGALGPAEAELRAILVIAGVTTALLGAAMALVQRHLKRLLGFVTVAYLGLLLTGIGLLNADGLAGAAVFAAGDGFLKAALFVAVGIVQRRTGHVEEHTLGGAARSLPYTGGLFCVAALAVAALPPFGSFAGKSLIEHGASSEGYEWLVPVFIAVSALVGAALLKSAGRIFLELGCRPSETCQDDEREMAEEEHETGEEHRRDERTSPVMFAVGATLVGAALALGLIPGLSGHAVAAAERFIDRPDYAGQVLRDTAGPHSMAPDTTPDLSSWLYAALELALAVAGAAVLLWGGRVRRGPLPAVAALVARPLGAVRALHSGHPGDYVAFVVAGAALLSGVCALTLT